MAARITHRMLKDSPVCGEVLPLSGVTFASVLPFSGLVTLPAANAVADRGEHENEYQKNGHKTLHCELLHS